MRKITKNPIIPMLIIIAAILSWALKASPETPANSVKVPLEHNRIEQVIGNIPGQIPEFTLDKRPNYGEFILGFRLEDQGRSIVVPDRAVSGKSRILFRSADDAFDSAYDSLNVFKLNVAGGRIIGVNEVEQNTLVAPRDFDEFNSSDIYPNIVELDVVDGRLTMTPVSPLLFFSEDSVEEDEEEVDIGVTTTVYLVDTTLMDSTIASIDSTIVSIEFVKEVVLVNITSDSGETEGFTLKRKDGRLWLVIRVNEEGVDGVCRQYQSLKPLPLRLLDIIDKACKKYMQNS